MPKKFSAYVKPNGKGPEIKVFIEAETSAIAQRLLEGQYGKGNVRAVYMA